jgi:hypothetical protein
MIDNFFKMAYIEATNARDIHGRIRSTHEALGLLEEEFWEVKLEIFKKVPDKQELLKELSQVAALCARLAEDCGLMDAPSITEERSFGSFTGSLPSFHSSSSGQTQDSSRKVSED